MLTNEQEDFEMSSPIFPLLIIRNRREWERNPRHTRCYVQFNPLITHSINKMAYRQFDYVTFMAFKRQLARWFHKRLSHNYVQASLYGPALQHQDEHGDPRQRPGECQPPAR